MLIVSMEQAAFPPPSSTLMTTREALAASSTTPIELRLFKQTMHGGEYVSVEAVCFVALVLIHILRRQ
ncbi:hypothetical protein L249_5493, partial [Ophiocordyceps polyrhachis-furcata BCC 54312]